tara:strand:- start:246 stop:1592 length:1347 start_codon:yes stop_codon:yes gene_type:complete
MPLILGTNSIKDTGFDVANSLRFNSGSNQFFEKVMGTPTSTKIGTFSCWVKLGNITTEQTMLGAYADSNNRHHIEFQADHNIEIFGKASGSTNMELITNAYYRDPSAWQNIVVAYDTSQGTASNRVKLYVNGTQVTSFATETYPSQDTVLQFNTDGSTHTVGRNKGGNYADGYMCEVVFIDGQQLTPTSFGEFDSDTNIWKPIDVSSLTGGNIGFYLDFEDGSNLGNDVFGGTDFDETNITSTNQSTDTCTLNMATLNSLDKNLSNVALSEGNLKMTTSATNVGGRATIGVSSGKWFWEVKIEDKGSNVAIIGIAQPTNWDLNYVGSSSTSYGYSSGAEKYNNTSSSSYGASWTTNDIIGVALNMDDGEIAFYKNGSSQGTAYTGIPTTDFMLPAFSGQSGTDFLANFGSPPYSESGGNSDGNGYGNFSMTVPSGYFCINTKNLAEYG